MNRLLINQKGKVISKVTHIYAITGRISPCRFLKGNHRRNRKFHNFSLKLYVSVKDFFQLSQCSVKENLMGFENNVMVWSFQDAKDFVSTLIKIIKENLMGFKNNVVV